MTGGPAGTPGPASSPGAGGSRIELVTTEGVFALDGGEWEVTNNVWLVGDDRTVVVVDAAHDHVPIVDAVAGRRVAAIACTHGHNDHVNAAVALSAAVDAPVCLHPADRMLWDAVHPGVGPDLDLADGEVLAGGGCQLVVAHTPGHSPGSCCLIGAGLGGGGTDVVFSGDTLFCGGPGATGRSHSDFPTIIRSIRERLLTLPPQTIVHTGHGESTTIGAEAPHLREWIARGH
ncbi:MAG TPA: MBL fold metallo-hydrolase [Acidimicrobiales bacterium]|nr:MBL fold metallo-hydrolase [Acidimicrobiales bacterium]